MIRKTWMVCVLMALTCLTGCKRGEKAPTTQKVEQPAISAKDRNIEEAPAGVAFLDTAPTIEELMAKTKADLAWEDPDGARLFMWIKPAEKKNTWTITMNRAYQVRQSGKVFWGFVDPANLEKYENGSPEKVFMFSRHIRDTILCPTQDHHDYDYSSAEVLTPGNGGKAVLKIIYCSPGGWSPGQEDIRVYLVYATSDGHVQLATQNIGHEGSYTHTYEEGNSDRYDMKVIWHKPNDINPFHLEVVYCYQTWFLGESEFDNFEVCQDGMIKGDFPMRIIFSNPKYFVGDGKLTLENLAKSMSKHSYIEVKPLYLEELKKLNPGLSAKKAIPKGKRVIVPEFSDRPG